MIYQYPEEFIVPVVYVQDFKDKTFYRCKKSKTLDAGKLLMSDEDLNEHEIFVAEVDIDVTFGNKDINFLNMDEKILQEPIFKNDKVETNLEDESGKSILSDIDEEYSNSETLNMKV